MWALIWALVLFSGTCFVNSETLTITKEEGPGSIVDKEDGTQELRLAQGDNLSLVCTVTGSPNLVWGLWYGKGQGLSYNNELLHPDKVRFSVEERSTDSATSYTLRIDDLTFNDQGEYQCQGQGDTTAEIQVLVTTPPNITEITPMQTAEESDTISLVCKAFGSPVPTIRWHHVRPTNQMPNGIEGAYKEGINLDITSITIDDRGEYECIASNGVPDEETVMKKTTYIRMNYPPSVEAIVKDNPVVNVQEGQAASLTCKSMAYPRSSNGEVVWSFEMNELSEEDGYTVEVVNQLPGENVDPYEETTYSVLQIPEVNVNTTGQYKCQFSNLKGNGQAFITVEIDEREPVVDEQEPVADGEDECCKGSALSTSVITIVTMLSAILWLVH